MNLMIVRNYTPTLIFHTRWDKPGHIYCEPVPLFAIQVVPTPAIAIEVVPTPAPP